MHHKARLFARSLPAAAPATALLAGLTALAGCPSASPSGFSKGDHWTFPLVGPLEDGALITTGTVRDKGPYLFLIDPDANISVIDEQIVKDAALTTGQGPTRVDETGAEQMRGYAQLIDMKLGDLIIDSRLVMAVPSDFYNTEGRKIDGVIGRDVIADALVFGFDREQGVAMLSTAQVFKPPPDAVALKYTAVQADPTAASANGGTPAMEASNVEEASRVGIGTRRGGPSLDVSPLPRRMVSAQIGGTAVSMHLDPGGPVSQLREALWDKVKATPADAKLRLVDEVATVRQVTKVASADVTVDGAKAHVRFAPYTDKRYTAGKIDGALGLDFFKPYAVHANWGASTFYLRPRGDQAATLAARLGRWGAALPACPHPGCVTATVTSTSGGVRLDIVRDAEAAKRPLEVWLGAKAAAGKTAPPLVAELPAGVDKISGAMPDGYEGATFSVLDVSPFTRPCSGDAGCVFQFASHD